MTDEVRPEAMEIMAARNAAKSGVAIGVVLAVLGVLAVMAPLMTGIGATVMIGALMFIGGASLEDRMDRDPDEVDAEEILRMRSDLVTLGALVSDQLTAVQAMSATARPFFQIEDAREYVSCELVNLQSADRSLDWLDSRIGTLRSGFEMHAQDQTNRRLNILTILSAIFNPATLLAGVWGMNFAVMPELGWHFGYPMALGLMFAIGCLMFLFFRSGGWFD